MDIEEHNKENWELSIAYFPGDYFEAEGLIPCPMMDEIAREVRVRKAIEGKWLAGYWCEVVGRKKNPVFDKKGEKSSVKIKWRFCHTEDEAKFIVKKVQEILKRSEV